jgi:hypothetical protein
LILRSGDEPGALNPTWYHAASGFVELGIEHILTGFDHLLFLFALVIPVRRLRRLIAVITAFTLAHSITLFASAFHLAPQGAWFPPFVEMAIAATIVYTAFENILKRTCAIVGSWRASSAWCMASLFQCPGTVVAVRGLASASVAGLVQRRNRGSASSRSSIMWPALVLFGRLVAERTGIVILSSVVALIGGALDRRPLANVLSNTMAARDRRGPRHRRWVVAALMVLAAARMLSAWLVNHGGGSKRSKAAAEERARATTV